MHLPTAIGIIISAFLWGVFCGYVLGLWQWRRAHRAALRSGKASRIWTPKGRR